MFDALVGSLFKIRKPTIAAASEPSKILIFALCMISELSKAKIVTKMDIVNPIPPRKPAPIICFQDTSLGSCDNPILTANALNRKMPSGFPTNKPTKIPKLFNVNKPTVQLSVKVTQVLARTKSGMMMKDTGLCRKCCSL